MTPPRKRATAAKSAQRHTASSSSSTRKAAAKKAAPAKKAAAKKATPPKASTAAKKTTARRASKPAEAAPNLPKEGTVERSVYDELVAMKLIGTAHASTALLVARHCDKADSPAAAAVAARELRMQLAAARNVGNPLSPLSGAGDPDDDGESTGGQGLPPGVPSLEEMRNRAAARQSS